MTSAAAVCSELLWLLGEQFSHMVQSSTYFTCSQDVCKSFMWCIKPIGPNMYINSIDELDNTCYAIIGDWNTNLHDIDSSMFAGHM